MQRPARVQTGILHRVQPLADAKQRDLLAVHDDQMAAVSGDVVEWADRTKAHGGDSTRQRGGRARLNPQMRMRTPLELPIPYTRNWWCGVLALVCCLPTAARAEPDVAELFRPASGRYPLRSLTAAHVSRLSKSARLRARGLDPKHYREAPSVEDQVAQWNNIRHRLFPGFAYEKRLALKRADFFEVRSGLPSMTWVRLLDRARLRAPTEFVQKNSSLLETLPRNRYPTQPLQALRHSERQFHSWYAREFARRLNELTASDRADIVFEVGERLGRGPVWRRILAARVLGEVADPRCEQLLRDAVAPQRDPAVVGAIMGARLQRGGPGAIKLLQRWARSPRAIIQRTALRLCEQLDERWVVPLLESVLKTAKGRLRDQLEHALSRKRGGEPNFEDTPLSFYGIPTHSRAVMFCIDVSGSMALPLDGKGGTRPIRIEKTKRELLRAFSQMPSSVKFSLVLFAEGVEPWSRRMVNATDRNKERALEFLEKRKVIGGTNVYSALDFAHSSSADTIFLLTDGEPSVGAMVDPALIMEEFAMRDSFGFKAIHTIGLAQDQNAELLVNLAYRHDGQYVPVR